MTVKEFAKMVDKETKVQVEVYYEKTDSYFDEYLGDDVYYTNDYYSYEVVSIDEYVEKHPDDEVIGFYAVDTDIIGLYTRQGGYYGRV